MTKQDVLNMLYEMEKNTPKSSFLESRITLLNALHRIMQNMNDERAYLGWIELVPDEATIFDFEDIAMDDNDFEEILNWFITLFKEFKYAE